MFRATMMASELIVRQGGVLYRGDSAVRLKGDEYLRKHEHMIPLFPPANLYYCLPTAYTPSGTSQR